MSRRCPTINDFDGGCPNGELGSDWRKIALSASPSKPTVKGDANAIQSVTN
ncbi:MAG: hypothetical protein AAGD11_14255 [Planctomycetota bacterium]